MSNKNKDTECILYVPLSLLYVLVVTYLHLPTNFIVVLNEILSQVHKHANKSFQYGKSMIK